MPILECSRGITMYALSSSRTHWYCPSRRYMHSTTGVPPAPHTLSLRIVMFFWKTIAAESGRWYAMMVSLVNPAALRELRKISRQPADPPASADAEKIGRPDRNDLKRTPLTNARRVGDRPVVVSQ